MDSLKETLAATVETAGLLEQHRARRNHAPAGRLGCDSGSAYSDCGHLRHELRLSARTALALGLSDGVAGDHHDLWRLAVALRRIGWL